MQKTDKYSTTRFKKMRYLKSENNRFGEAIKTHLENADLPADRVEFMHKLRTSVIKCSSLSLYAHSHEGISYITSLPCNHKVCNICNWQRQKKIRRKYMRWFRENETLPVVEKEGRRKIITNNRLPKFEEKGYRKISDVKYDLMHLVLTVPHTVSGWNGKLFYFDLIKERYNLMRKHDEWLKWVYGGEYGVESTRDHAGYHIHIHSLLFVRKTPYNRNQLHLVIFRIWNSLTTDSSNKRKPFTEAEIQAIKSGNRMMTDDFVAHLNPQGATLIHLKNMHIIKNGVVIYPQEWNDETMLKAVMETISYHFKPKMFFESEKNYDMEAIAELLPEVYGIPLYSKFGCLHGETPLNVNDDSLLEDYEETAEEAVLSDRTYFIANPLDFYVKDEKIIQKKVSGGRVEVLRAHTGREAVQELSALAFKNSNRHANN